MTILISFLFADTTSSSLYGLQDEILYRGEAADNFNYHFQHEQEKSAQESFLTSTLLFPFFILEAVLGASSRKTK